MGQQPYWHEQCWLRLQSGYQVDFYGTNPSPTQVHTKIAELAQQHQVPSEIIGAVAYHESIGLFQYGSDGFVVHNIPECECLFNGGQGCTPLANPPPGLGMMQLTGLTATQDYDVGLLITDWQYNLCGRGRGAPFKVQHGAQL
jgi:hypothetical protein